MAQSSNSDSQQGEQGHKRKHSFSSSSRYASLESLDESLDNNSGTDVLSLLQSLNKKMDKNLRVTNEIKKEMCDLKRTVNCHENRLIVAESGIVKLETSVDQLSKENEAIQTELRKLNLIFAGVSDDQNETEDELFRKIRAVISKTTELDIPFDTFYRLGNFNPSKDRPIKIRFISLRQRNIIYDNRSKLSSPHFINEDLPYSTRRTNAILRNKRKEAISNGVANEDIRINYRTKQVSIKDQVYDILSLEAGTMKLSSTSVNAQNNFLGATPPIHSSATSTNFFNLGSR